MNRTVTSEDRTPPDWKTIGARLGLDDAGGFAWNQVKPALETVPQEDLGKDGRPKTGLETPIGLAFGAFTITFTAIAFLTPDVWWMVTLKFILFFGLFFGFLGLALWFSRDRIVALIMRGEARFIARSAAMKTIADAVGLDYTPAPGGAPASIQLMNTIPFLPPELKSLSDTFDRMGGMDDVVAIARRSGVMQDAILVVGSEATREKFEAQQAASRNLENGFSGQRGEASFHAFEAIETVDEAPDIHHLVLVFTAPWRLHGVTQLRSRGISWPPTRSGKELEPVRLLSKAFEDRFRLRSSDQMEARLVFDPAVIERVVELAHDEKVRACAFENHLVIDIAGGDRFAPVSITTGAWDEHSIAKAMTDVADLLDLVDAVAKTFRVRG